LVKITLITIATILAVLLYTAWLNRLFLRCPHCRKIGAWRFDVVEPATVSKDEDGVVQSSRQIRVCRKCGKRVVDTWSDHGGRTLEKMNDGAITTSIDLSKLIEPWFQVTGEGPALAEELRREIAPGHVLFGKDAVAVARRHDCDDVLFALAHGVAVVHLAYAGREKRSDYPETELFDSWAHFVTERLARDARERLG
jgi:hypothetical protein